MIDNEGWRAAVLYESPLLGFDGGVVVSIGRRLPHGAREYVTGIDETGGLTVQRVEDGMQQVTINLPGEIARALLDGLAKHYGGTGDTRQLRKDFDAERGRVDKLIGVLSEVATRGQA